MTPIETAPAQNTSRGCQTRREAHIARERRSMGCFRDVPAIVERLGPVTRVPGLGKGFRAISSKWLARWTSPKYAGLFEFGGSYGGAYLLRRALYMPWELTQVLDPEIVRTGWKTLQPVLNADNLVHEISSARGRVTALELQLYMRNMLLRDADWASMAHSVEVRVPFVDVQLFRSLAPFVGGRYPLSKQMIANAPDKPLPSVITQRKKTGFSIPTQQWIGDRVGSDRGLRGWARFLMDAFTTDLEQHDSGPSEMFSNRSETGQRAGNSDLLP